jgi:hypothetical protein
MRFVDSLAEVSALVSCGETDGAVCFPQEITNINIAIVLINNFQFFICLLSNVVTVQYFLRYYFISVPASIEVSHSMGYDKKILL